ncbi:MAG TPA: ISAzo13 family transposase [Streptosporangiaceae bacterium]|nr:ISAzo13 family transposase [Streptosporangiaceae bacterium]
MGPELELLLPRLDERSRRLVLGAVARAAGDGGVTAVAKAAGASWQTVADGAAELASGDDAGPGRVRRPGGGRKKLEERDPRLIPALRELLEASTRGDPGSLLTWTTLSVRGIAAELTAAGHRCAKNAVLRMLHAEGFSTQGNSRTAGGKRHPDRDAQFRYINDAAREFLAAGDPVISIDTKKKELVGLYARKGREWRPKGDPRRVRDHDFPDPDGGKAIPYGVYDIGDNSGFVSVGTDHDTAQFAVESVRRWWDAIGKDRYPGAARLLVTCDAGGSNGYRARAWKAELARLAAGTGLEITVCHFPPGTSKWNKIEHRLFCHITRTWRGRPLTSYEVVVNTIAATATSTGLTVTAVLDAGRYPTGAEVTDTQMKDLEDRVIARHGFHGDWNYTILAVPRPAPDPGPAPAPAPQPSRPAADLAALDQPALTGLPPGGAAALAAVLAEARLRAARGGRDRQRPPTAGNDSRQKITFTGHVLAAILSRRFALPASHIAVLFGCDRSTIGHELPRTGQLLAATATTIPPGPVTLATYQDLRDYAAGHGITLPAPPGRTPPARHASNPGHTPNSP